MSKRLRLAGLILLAVFAAAQLIRPDRTNPPTIAERTIQAHVGTANGMVAILDRACRDCHSNQTAWPWYSQIAPVSWLMAYGVAKGRTVLNFSEWGTYAPERQRQLLAETCLDVSTGKMPGPYTLIRPETRLSPQDIATICAVAQQTGRDSLVGNALENSP